VLVLETTPPDAGETHTVLTVAPICFEPEMAGPHDWILPFEALGCEAVAVLSASVGMLADNLGNCLGALPPEITDPVLDCHHWVRAGAPEDSAPPAESRGFDYFHPSDLRRAWHEELVENLEYLQTPWIAWAEQSGQLDWKTKSQTADSETIPFPGDVIVWLPLGKRDFALAAADGVAERPLETRTAIVEGKDTRIQLMELEGQRDAFVLVVENDAEGLLEGAEVLDAGGSPQGTIRNGLVGSAQAPLLLVREGAIQFSIRLADGTPAKLVPAP
jgi:hypothetical protein